MKQWIFNITAAISLLLLLGMVFLLLWSIVQEDTNVIFLPLPGKSLRSVWIDYTRPDLYVSLYRTRPSKGSVWTRSSIDIGFAGFSQGFSSSDDIGAIFEHRTIFVNGFLLVPLFAILPAIWLFMWRKRRKLSPNACHSCGYDLTANTSGTCPECGTIIITDPAEPTPPPVE